MTTKLMTSCLISAITLCSLAYSGASFASNQQNSPSVRKPLKINNISIEQISPVWTLPAGNNPLLQRDAKLLPVEQPLALAIRPLLNQKDYAGALAAIDLVSKPEYEPEPIFNLSPALLQVKGQIYLSLNKDEQAKESFLAAIAQLPDFIRAHKSLAVIYIKQKNYQQAREHLVKTITLGEGDAQLFGYLAYINLQLSTPWSAIAGYEQALLLEPENQQWQQGLLYSLINAKDNHAAKAMLNEMLQKTPNDARLWLQRSRISLDDNTPLDALTSMEMAVRLGNTDADNLIATAQLHLNHGSVSRAADLMAQLLTAVAAERNLMLPVKIPNTSMLLSQSSLGWFMKNIGQKRKNYLNTVTSTPNKLATYKKVSSNYIMLVYLAIVTKKITQLYEQAIKLAPTNGKALIALAEHYQKNNDYTQAQMLFIRAASLEGFAERAFIGHAQVYIEQKNYDQAAALLRKALKLNPSRQDLVQNIRLLDRMNNSQI